MTKYADYVSFKDGKVVIEKSVNGKNVNFGSFDTLEEALNMVKYLDANDWKVDSDVENISRTKYEDYISYSNGKFIVEGEKCESKTFDNFEDAFEYISYLYSQDKNNHEDLQDINESFDNCPFCGADTSKMKYKGVDFIFCNNFPECHFSCSTDVFDSYNSEGFSDISLKNEIYKLKKDNITLNQEINNLKNLVLEIKSIFNKNL